MGQIDIPQPAPPVEGRASPFKRLTESIAGKLPPWLREKIPGLRAKAQTEPGAVLEDIAGLDQPLGAEKPARELPPLTPEQQFALIALQSGDKDTIASTLDAISENYNTEDAAQMYAGLLQHYHGDNAWLIGRVVISRLNDNLSKRFYQPEEQPETLTDNEQTALSEMFTSMGEMLPQIRNQGDEFYIADRVYHLASEFTQICPLTSGLLEKFMLTDNRDVLEKAMGIVQTLPIEQSAPLLASFFRRNNVSYQNATQLHAAALDAVSYTLSMRLAYIAPEQPQPLTEGEAEAVRGVFSAMGDALPIARERSNELLFARFVVNTSTDYPGISHLTTGLLERLITSDRSDVVENAMEAVEDLSTEQAAHLITTFFRENRRSFSVASRTGAIDRLRRNFQDRLWERDGHQPEQLDESETTALRGMFKAIGESIPVAIEQQGEYSLVADIAALTEDFPQMLPLTGDLSARFMTSEYSDVVLKALTIVNNLPCEQAAAAISAFFRRQSRNIISVLVRVIETWSTNLAARMWRATQQSQPLSELEIASIRDTFSAIGEALPVITSDTMGRTKLATSMSRLLNQVPAISPYAQDLANQLAQPVTKPTT